VLAWSSKLFVPPLLGTGPSRHTQKRLPSTPVRSDDVRGTWAGLSARQLPPATYSCVTLTLTLTLARFSDAFAANLLEELHTAPGSPVGRRGEDVRNNFLH